MMIKLKSKKAYATLPNRVDVRVPLLMRDMLRPQMTVWNNAEVMMTACISLLMATHSHVL